MSTPPACNTGVKTPSTGPSMEFDFYRATVPAHHEAIVAGALQFLAPGAHRIDGKGRFNYKHLIELREGNERVISVLHGGKNGHPNVEASGGRAPAMAAFLRAGGAHRVTRCDVAVDLVGEGLYGTLKATVEGIADRMGVRCEEIVNRDPSTGNTIYLGPKLGTHARVYEKGKYDGRDYGVTDPYVLRHWCRVELQVMPEKEMKAKAARMQLEEFWGIRAWTRQLALEAFDMTADRTSFNPTRTLRRDDNAWTIMGLQYHKLARRICDARFGGDTHACAEEWRRMMFEREEDADRAAA